MNWIFKDVNNYVCGDYVLTKVYNAFNNNISFWISKKGYTVSFYCFTYYNENDFQKQIKNPSDWINYFENRIKTCRG